MKFEYDVKVEKTNNVSTEFRCEALSTVLSELINTNYTALGRIAVPLLAYSRNVCLLIFACFNMKKEFNFPSPLKKLKSV